MPEKVNQIKVFILILVVVLIGISFATTIANTIDQQTSSQPIYNETLDISSLRAAHNDIYTNVSVYVDHNNTYLPSAFAFCTVGFCVKLAIALVNVASVFIPTVKRKSKSMKINIAK